MAADPGSDGGTITDPLTFLELQESLEEKETSSVVTCPNIVDDYFVVDLPEPSHKQHLVAPNGAALPSQRDRSSSGAKSLDEEARKRLTKRLTKYVAGLRSAATKNMRSVVKSTKRVDKLKATVRRDTDMLASFMLLRKLEVLKQHARVQMALLKNEADMYRHTLAQIKDHIAKSEEMLQLLKSDFQTVEPEEKFFKSPQDIFKDCKLALASAREDLQLWLSQTKQIYEQVCRETEEEELVDRGERVRTIVNTAYNYYEAEDVLKYTPCRSVEQDFDVIMLDMREKEGQVIAKWLDILRTKSLHDIPPAVITKFISEFTKGFIAQYSIPPSHYSIVSILIQRTIYGRLRRLNITPHGHWKPTPNLIFDDKDATFAKQVEWMKHLTMEQLGVEPCFQMNEDTLLKYHNYQKNKRSRAKSKPKFKKIENAVLSSSQPLAEDSDTAGNNAPCDDSTGSSDQKNSEILTSIQIETSENVITPSQSSSGKKSPSPTYPHAPTNINSPRVFFSSHSTLPSPYQIAIDALEAMNELIVPSDILQCLVHCAQLIYKTAREYEQINLRVQAFNEQHHKTDGTIEVPAAVTPLGADFFFPIFLYVTLQSRLPGLHRSLHMLQNFSSRSEQMSETGYYLSCLEGAVLHIMAATREQYNQLSSKEHQRKLMSSLLDLCDSDNEFDDIPSSASLSRSNGISDSPILGSLSSSSSDMQAPSISTANPSASTTNPSISTTNVFTPMSATPASSTCSTPVGGSTCSTPRHGQIKPGVSKAEIADSKFSDAKVVEQAPTLLSLLSSPQPPTSQHLSNSTSISDSSKLDLTQNLSTDALSPSSCAGDHQKTELSTSDSDDVTDKKMNGFSKNHIHRHLLMNALLELEDDDSSLETVKVTQVPIHDEIEGSALYFDSATPELEDSSEETGSTSGSVSGADVFC